MLPTTDQPVRPRANVFVKDEDTGTPVPDFGRGVADELISSIFSQLDIVSKSIDMLADRLVPVMKPAPDTVPVEMDEDYVPSFTAPNSIRLLDVHHRVESLHRHLDDLRGRLEV